EDESDHKRSYTSDGGRLQGLAEGDAEQGSDDAEQSSRILKQHGEHGWVFAAMNCLKQGPRPPAPAKLREGNGPNTALEQEADRQHSVIDVGIFNRVRCLDLLQSFQNGETGAQAA